MSVIGIEAHELRKFWRLLPHLTARLRDKSGPAIAAPDRGSNVDLKCLILGVSALAATLIDPPA